ncbi:MAG: tetratricopeptide repeat protein [Candidatus Binatia bacterium]|jgi:tetratricopeptide (TPR) repeat protein
MVNRFCVSCGAKLLPESNFCVECGERQGGSRTARRLSSSSLQRYAPILVVLAMVVVVGGVIAVGVLNPKAPPSVPGRGGPQTAGEMSGKLPEGHPPIAVPEKVKEAIREMAEKAAAAPDDLDIWKHLAEVQYRVGQIDPSYLPQAETSYRHLLEREPDNPDVLRGLGNIAFDQDRDDDAIGFYEKYLKLKPDDPDVQTDLGTMYLSAGKTEQAIRQYQAILEQNPSFFQAQFNLAIAYQTAGETDKVMPALEKARTMAKDDQTRNQVDQVMARVKGLPPPPAAPDAAAGAPAAAEAEKPVAAPAVAPDTFQGGMEAIFRQHPIIGPKVERIEWSAAESAKVYLRDFPMEQMPPEMVNTFTDRLKSQIKEQKDAHKVSAATRVELVDSGSGKVMETVIE